MSSDIWEKFDKNIRFVLANPQLYDDDDNDDIDDIDGLLVLQPFASMISNGTKSVEYRDYKPPDDKINKPIYILSNGRVFAKVKITSYFKDNGKFRWNLSVMKSYKPPLRYEHPNGAQKWVKNVNLK